MHRQPLGVALLALSLAVVGCEEGSAPLASESGALGPAAKKSIWKVPGDFPTIQDAIDDPAVSDGDVIAVGPGRFDGATVTKAVEIRARGGAIIEGGPLLVAGHPLGGDLEIGFFFQADHSGDGASIRGFGFEDVEFPVFSRGADGVTVSHNTMSAPVQGVTNWGGSGWAVEHNTIAGLRSICGGGIGILVGDQAATAAGVTSNVVAHNRIAGTLAVHPGDCGGYDGTGIVLFADFRFGRTGAVAISDNSVSKNVVDLQSDTPAVVDVVGFELTDTRDDGSLPPVIFDNSLVKNDARGTARGLELTPAELADHNEFSKNKGF